MIEISESQLRSIRQEAESRYPNESCGILIGTSRGDTKRVKLLVPAENNFSKEEQYHRYWITPEEYRSAERLASSEKLDIIGLYHSHPDHPARPSQFDLDHAWGWFSYIITSVANGTSGAMHSWVLNGDRTGFDEERITTPDELKEEELYHGDKDSYSDTPSTLHR